MLKRLMMGNMVLQNSRLDFLKKRENEIYSSRAAGFR